MSPEEVVAATSSKINDLGARFYFDPSTLAVGRELGLDGFRWYFLGRGGVLGDVEAPVISGAFGYFHSAVVDKMWTSAKQIMNPRDAGARYLDCNADLARSKIAGLEGLEEFCEAAQESAASVNPAGLSLFAGVMAEPLPLDLAGRAMQLLVIHRELRGCLHLVAVLANGLHPAVAHALRRPDAVEMFGWASGLEIPTDAKSRLRNADSLTDELNSEAYRPLSKPQQRAMVDGVEAIHSAFERS